MRLLRGDTVAAVVFDQKAADREVRAADHHGVLAQLCPVEGAVEHGAILTAHDAA